MQENCEYLIHAAEAFLDAETGSARHANIVKFYNEIAPLPRGYRLKASDAWCAAFVSAVGYIVALVPDVIRPECGAHEMYNAYPAGQRSRGGSNAKRGDLIFYDWNEDGRIDHVGICTFGADTIEEETYLSVIEGNCENTVKYRYIKASDPAIYGTVRPEYGDTTSILYVNCDSLNLRQGPSMDASVKAVMSYGEYVTAYGSDVDGWKYVEYDDKDGYCGADYLSSTPPPEIGHTTTALNLRKVAAGKIIRVLPAGTEFHYTGDREAAGGGTWERVYIPSMDISGWLNLKYTKEGAV